MGTTLPSTTIDLIRHGQPLGGARFRGQLNDPLSDAGWQDMREALGDQVPWISVISSPMLRCNDFAHDLARRNGLVCEVEPRFTEISFGEWEGRPHSEVMDSDGGRLRAFWANPELNPPPGGEPFERFRARVLDGWSDLMREHDGEHVLMIAHANVIRTVITSILGMPPDHYYRIEVPKARVTRIKQDERRGNSVARILFHGCRLVV